MSVAPSAPRCVFCRRAPVDPAWRPFCSERCKIQDLARWVDGTYTVPGERAGEPAQAEHEELEDDKDSV